MALRLGSRYELDEVLGRGGSGEVWRASSPDGPVAIKILRPELSNDPDIVERFVAERSLLLGVRSEHVVGVTDLVIEGDRLAIVMDLVEGGDLRTRLRAERTLRPGAAVELMTQVLDGLAEVHASGIVHRDLKPENLLLDDEWSVRVADFGIARLSSGTRATRTTGLLGTPRYVAPELSIRGRVTPAVDVYAAGVTLYEMLFGRVPFDGPHPAAVLRAHAEDLPYRPAGVPDPLWSLIAQMLEKNPQDRPTAAEAADRLRALAPSVRDVDRFPPLVRAGGPDTDDTYTTDPHGNATDLTGIGRRGRLQTTTGPVATRSRSRRWLVPAVAIVGILAIGLGTVAFAGGGSNEQAASGSPVPYKFDDTPQGNTAISHTWRYGPTGGNAVDGVMNVAPTGSTMFAEGASVVAIFPSAFQNLEFETKPEATEKITAQGPGNAARTAALAARFTLPAGKRSFAVSYTSAVPAGKASEDRFDAWSTSMQQGYAQLCLRSDPDRICPIQDGLASISFSQNLVPAIGPTQQLDASLLLQGQTKSGTTLLAGELKGASWSVDDPSRATIDNNGVVTGVTEGAALVTARIGDLQTGTPLAVIVTAQHQPAVTKISISGPASAKSAVSYSIVATYDNGSKGTALATWSVTPADAASIDATGLLRPARADTDVKVHARVLSLSGQTITDTKPVHIENFNPRADGDGDGVLDASDRCSSVPGLAKFDGCPDGDGDSVPEPPDACPGTPGLVQYSGCPDSDGDGIPEPPDACPGAAGTAQFNGCPDTDQDNVQDSRDKCPTVRGLARFDGCPDSDGDNVPEPPDACPGKAGPAQFNGCPDSDGDGLPDQNDQCPTQAGDATTGCPPKPDLIVTAIEPVGTLQAGQCVKFAVTIKNIGPGASPNVKHGILLYVDGGRSTMPWSDNYSQGLAPGESRTQTTNAGRGDTSCDPSGSMWRAVAGSHTIQAWVDDHSDSGNGLIDEVSGSNNRLPVPITVPA